MNDLHIFYNHVLNLNRNVTLCIVLKSQLVIPLLLQLSLILLEALLYIVPQLRALRPLRLRLLKLPYLLIDLCSVTRERANEFLQFVEVRLHLGGLPHFEAVYVSLRLGDFSVTD